MSLSDKYFDIIEKISEKFAIAIFGDRTWPDAAFMVEHGAEKDSSGKTLQKYRHLVHHNKNATNPNSNDTVDIPHLRNALARVNQVKPIKEDKAGFISRSKAHLQKHARALLKTYKSGAELKELEAICAEFNINIEDESVKASVKVEKNGDTNAPYCVMSGGKKIKCYSAMKDAEDHMNQMMNEGKKNMKKNKC